MRVIGINLIFAILLALNSTVFATEKQSTANMDHKIFTPNDIQWQDAPNSLPPGAKIAVLEGDPTKAGEFTMRLKFPAGYQIPAHYHPIIEHITVISGALSVGMGDKLDTNNAQELSTGTFAFIEPKMHHYAFNQNETIVQLHGVGPWGITYINASDDPRNKKS